jgi:hypothetical protein
MALSRYGLAQTSESEVTDEEGGVHSFDILAALLPPGANFQQRSIIRGLGSKINSTCNTLNYVTWCDVNGSLREISLN